MTPLTRPESVILFLASCATAATFDPARWEHRVPMLLPPDAAGKYVEVSLDAGAYRNATPSLNDLRVLSPGGFETPYILSQSQPETLLLRPRMIDRVQTANGGLQFVLDFGRARQQHNKLRFEWSEMGFRRAVRIESSDTQSEWSLVREAMLLDFRQDGLFFQTAEISYPDSTRRFLRVTISEWSDPRTLKGIESVRAPEGRGRFTEVAAVAPRPSASLPEDIRGDAASEFDAPFHMSSPLRLRLDLEGEDFVRRVILQSRSDGRPWRTICDGTIARAGGENQETLDCLASVEGRLRLVVRNRDNPPVRVRGIRLALPERRLLIKAGEAGTYWLYAGNPAAAKPSYDLNEVLARSPASQTLQGSLGAWQANPSYKAPPIPFSERFRDMLVPVLVVLILAIAGAAALLLRRSA